MPVKLPPYVVWDRPRAGAARRARFVRRGGPKRWMTAAPGTPEFAAEYAALLSGAEAPPQPRRRAGTFGAFVDGYERSAGFRAYDPKTRAQQSGLLARLVAQAPDAQPSALTATDVRRIRDNRAATPGAANNLVKALRALYRWGIEAGHVETNPTDGVARLSPASRDGFRAWTLREVDAWREAYPPGCDENLALAALLFTAARHSDACRFGPHSLSAGLMTWTQAKAPHSSVEIPAMPPLLRALEARDAARPALPLREPTWWLTAAGAARSYAGWGNWFRDRARSIGLDGCTPHGLRKAAGAILADCGCSEHEIMAVLGHSDPRTSSVYTRTANRRALAATAATKMQGFRW